MRLSLKLLLIGALLLISISCESVKHITLTSSNLVNLRGIINKENVDLTIASYKQLRSKNPKETIYLVIESPGGYLVEGGRLIEALKKDSNIKTITIFAASMASAIVEALPVERLMVPNGMFMFHRGGGVSTVLDLIQLEQSNADRLKINLNDYRMRVLREWWVEGSKAIMANMADRAVTISCDSSLDRVKDRIVANSFFGLFEIKLSRCPLVVQPI